jgi:hypothetical protein
VHFSEVTCTVAGRPVLAGRVTTAESASPIARAMTDLDLPAPARAQCVAKASPCQARSNAIDEFVYEVVNEAVFLVDMVGIEFADRQCRELRVAHELGDAFVCLPECESGVDGREIGCRKVQEVDDIDIEMYEQAIHIVWESGEGSSCRFGR